MGGKFGNLYLKIRNEIMFFMPIPKLIPSFSTYTFFNNKLISGVSK